MYHYHISSNIPVDLETVQCTRVDDGYTFPLKHFLFLASDTVQGSDPSYSGAEGEGFRQVFSPLCRWSCSSASTERQFGPPLTSLEASVTVQPGK